MRLLLDNTLIHQVGRVLDSSETTSIRNVDALALFHLAEHILFSDEVIVSNFESNATFDRTAGILDKLVRDGVTTGQTALFRLEPFDEQEYLGACERAGAGVLADLTGLSPKQFATAGSLADETARPDGTYSAPLDSWLSNSSFLNSSPDRIASLTAQRAAGSCELTVLQSPPLYAALKSLRGKTKQARDRTSAALTAIVRINVNQELATMRAGIYAPAPQRARISALVDVLFRQQLERMIQKEVRAARPRPHPLLAQLSGPASLPLPLFAFYALRTQRLHSPRAILEAAVAMREDSEIKWMRRWLGDFEDKHASLDDGKRVDALSELNRLAAEIAARLSGKRTGLLANLSVGSFEADPETSQVSWTPPMHSIAELLALMSRRRRRQRRLLAVLTSELSSDDELGCRILQQLGRPLKK